MCVIDEHRLKTSAKSKKVFANIVGKIFMIFVGSEDNSVDVLNILLKISYRGPGTHLIKYIKKEIGIVASIH